MITVNTAAGYTTTQRTMAREGLEIHDAGCCTPGNRCWMGEGLERIVSSTRSTVVMVPVTDAPLSRGNGNSTGRGRVADTATDKQMSYIGSMLAELESAPADFPGIASHNMLRAALVAGESFTKRQASVLIEKLKGDTAIVRAQRASAPKPVVRPVAPNVPVKPVTEGMYELDGSVYRVKMGRSGYLYAMILVIENGEGRLEMSRGTIRRIRPEHRMSLERASELSVRYHFCVRCTQELTRESSIAAGMGPDCAAAM